MGTNKKKRDRYKAQQEARKKGTDQLYDHPLVVGWRARYETVRSEAYEAANDRDKLKKEHQFLEKTLADMERTTAHEIRMRESMQESHKLIKESFAQLRNMHKKDYANMCTECMKPFPCPTIVALKEPTDFVITDLIKMAGDLDDRST